MHNYTLKSIKLSCCSCSVGGLGFGLIAGIVAYANVIEAASGPGITGIDGDTSQYFLLTSGKHNINNGHTHGTPSQGLYTSCDSHPHRWAL